MKLVVRIVLGVLVAAICFYGYLYYQNNRAAQPLSRDDISRNYEKGVAWLLDHHDEIRRDGNPMLWWMLRESARINGDARVKKLVDEFLVDFDRAAPYNVWQALFYPERFRNVPLAAAEYISLVDYQQHFLYGLTCSRQLEQKPLIQAQNRTNFCWRGKRIIRPACVTHQLMAFQMIQRNGCGIEGIEEKMAASQKAIITQLEYDPRVVDVYVQRALMLANTGALDRIKPRWLERIMRAQLSDGGWSDMQPLIPIGGGRYLGFNATAVTIADPIANFHATAQGILLTTLLLNN